MFRLEIIDCLQNRAILWVNTVHIFVFFSFIFFGSHKYVLAHILCYDDHVMISEHYVNTFHTRTGTNRVLIRPLNRHNGNNNINMFFLEYIYNRRHRGCLTRLAYWVVHGQLLVRSKFRLVLDNSATGELRHIRSTCRNTIYGIYAKMIHSFTHSALQHASRLNTTKLVDWNDVVLTPREWYSDKTKYMRNCLISHQQSRAREDFWRMEFHLQIA